MLFYASYSIIIRFYIYFIEFLRLPSVNLVLFYTILQQCCNLYIYFLKSLQLLPINLVLFSTKIYTITFFWVCIVWQEEIFGSYLYKLSADLTTSNEYIHVVDAVVLLIVYGFVDSLWFCW